MGLQIDHVHARSGTFELAADLTISAGIRVAVIGASGSGKSTLLDVIAGFLPVESGSIRWAGQDITHASPADRPVSILFQDTNLFPHLSIGQTLALALNPRTGRLGTGDAERIADSLTRVGLPGFADRRLSQISGGQQSRAALARVLLQARPVLLLDEPFAALDEITRQKLNDDLLSLKAKTGATVIFVTHSVFESVFLSDRILIMAARPGRVIREITVDAPYPRGIDWRTAPEYGVIAREASATLHGALAQTEAAE